MFLKIQKEMKTSHFCNILKMMPEAHPLQTNIYGESSVAQICYSLLLSQFI